MIQDSIDSVTMSLFLHHFSASLDLGEVLSDRDNIPDVTSGNSQNDGSKFNHLCDILCLLIIGN